MKVSNRGNPSNKDFMQILMLMMAVQACQLKLKKCLLLPQKKKKKSLLRPQNQIFIDIMERSEWVKTVCTEQNLITPSLVCF